MGARWRLRATLRTTCLASALLGTHLPTFGGGSLASSRCPEGGCRKGWGTLCSGGCRAPLPKAGNRLPTLGDPKRSSLVPHPFCSAPARTCDAVLRRIRSADVERASQVALLALISWPSHAPIPEVHQHLDPRGAPTLGASRPYLGREPLPPVSRSSSCPASKRPRYITACGSCPSAQCASRVRSSMSK